MNFNQIGAIWSHHPNSTCISHFAPLGVQQIPLVFYKLPSTARLDTTIQLRTICRKNAKNKEYAFRILPTLFTTFAQESSDFDNAVTHPDNCATFSY